MTRVEVKMRQRYLREQNRQYGEALSLVPRTEWTDPIPPRLSAVYRSSRYLVQVFDESCGVTRLTVCRTMIDDAGEWVDVSPEWDVLQRLKREAGFGDREAVEIYPPDADVVNVASMRHLWLLPAGERMPFSWRCL